MTHSHFTQPIAQHIDLAILLAAIVLTLALTVTATSGPLLFDDHSTILPLLATAPDGLTALVDQHLFTHSGPTGRPVSMATFIANATLHGDRLWAWKLTNLALHITIGSLLYLLGKRLANLCGTDTHAAGLIAVAVATIWLLHPLHVSTVFYTVQRMTMLSALFVTLGLLAYLASRKRFMDGSRGVAWGLAACMGCAVLATLSKENGALMPLYILVIEAVAPGRCVSPRDACWRRAVITFVLVLLSAALAIALQQRLISLDSGYASRPFDLVERLWTESRVVVEYLTLTLAPRLDAMSFFHDDMALSSGPLSPPSTLVALLVLLLLLVSAWALRRRIPLYAIGIGLFLSGHLLESTIIPLHLMYEHRQYFPSFGLLLAVAALFAWLPLRPTLRAGSATAFAGLCALLLSQRAAAWSDEWRLYESLLDSNPNSPGIAIVVGNSLAEAGEINAAREILERFDTPSFQLNVAYLDCLDTGRLEPGRLAAIETPGRFDFHERSVIIGLGNAAIDGRCQFDQREFIELTDRWLEPPALAPHDQTVRHRAFAFARLGDLERAIDELERLQSRYPQLTEALYLAARWRLDAGEMASARMLATRAREVELRLGIQPTVLSEAVWNQLNRTTP